MNAVALPTLSFCLAGSIALLSNGSPERPGPTESFGRKCQMLFDKDMDEIG